MNNERVKNTREKLHVSIDSNILKFFREQAHIERKSLNTMFEDIACFYFRYSGNYKDTIESDVRKIKEILFMFQKAKLEILVDNKPLNVLEKNNEKYVKGTPGKEYKIRVTASSARRKKLVCTVDGLCVITGKRGNYKTNGGYIFQHSEIVDGWRSSDSHINKFEFSDIDDSYAAKSREGNKENVGQIAIAVFNEKEREQKTAFTNDLSSKAKSMSTRSKCGGQSLGTAWGDEAESHVRSVEFNSEAEPFSVQVINYRSEKQLLDMGFSLNEIHGKSESFSKAFPGMTGFCEPPE